MSEIHVLNLFLDEVSDMLEKLYPTTVDVQYKKWTTRIREIFSTVSELECGAHAALAPGPIDYFIYLDGNCYLGDIPHGSSSSGDETMHNIRIRRGKYKISKNCYLFDELCICCISAAYPLHIRCIFATYPLHIHCISTASPLHMRHAQALEIHL